MATKKIQLSILSVVLAAATFVGVPLNGGDKGWLYVNDAFRSFIVGNFRNENAYALIIQILLMVSSVALYLMPILVFVINNRKLTLYVPLIYLLLTFLYFPHLIILCVPFIFIWGGLLLFVRINKNELQ